MPNFMDKIETSRPKASAVLTSEKGPSTPRVRMLEADNPAYVAVLNETIVTYMKHFGKGMPVCSRMFFEDSELERMDKDFCEHVAHELSLSLTTISPGDLSKKVVEYIHKLSEEQRQELVDKGFQPCIHCLKPGFGGKGLDKPQETKGILGYDFTLVDVEREYEKDGEKKKFKEDPIKVFEVPNKNSGEYWSVLTEAKEAGEFLFSNQAKAEDLSILRFLRKKKQGDIPNSGGLAKPEFLNRMQLRSLAGGKNSKDSQFKLEVPVEVLEKWNNKSRGEMYGVILSAYGGVKERRAYLEAGGVIFPDTDKTPEEEPAALSSSLDA
jgi:hypothetical protein